MTLPNSFLRGSRGNDSNSGGVEQKQHQIPMDTGPLQSPPHQQQPQVQQLALNQIMAFAAQHQQQQQQANIPSLSSLFQQQQQQQHNQVKAQQPQQQHQPGLNNVLLTALLNQIQHHQQAQAQQGSQAQAGLGGAAAALIQAAQMQQLQQPSSQAASSNQSTNQGQEAQLQFMQKLQILQQLAHNQNQAYLSQQQQQQHQSFGQGQDAGNRNSNKRAFQDDHQAVCVPEAVASAPSSSKVARTMHTDMYSAPASAAPNSTGGDGGTQHQRSVASTGITAMDTCMEHIPEDRGEEPVPSFSHAVQGAVLVPCRARGMPVDHNFKVCICVASKYIVHHYLKLTFLLVSCILLLSLFYSRPIL
jgi:hypothetical protein